MNKKYLSKMWDRSAKDMLSSDYKVRFVAEYVQLKIRCIRLSDFLEKFSEGKLDFKPTCSLTLLDRQCCTMRDYLDCLVRRAKVEKIKLPKLCCRRKK